MQDHRQKRIQKNFRDAQRLRMKREAAEKVKMESDAEEAPRLRRRVYTWNISVCHRFNYLPVPCLKSWTTRWIRLHVHWRVK